MLRDESGSSSSSGSIGFVGLLTIVFVLLKVFEVIDWSWWWVFSPVWISAGLALVFLILAVIVMSMLNK